MIKIGYFKRPILRGRDIKKYSYEFADLWLLYIPWHFPLQNDLSITGASDRAEEEFKIQYPAIYNHLLKHKKGLSNRNKSETGIRYEWYALQRWGSNYWEDFSKQKIIYPNMTKFLPFVYDEKGFLTNQKCFIITGQNIPYLTAFLNSSLFKFCYKENFPELQGGTRELSKIYFDKIFVKKIEHSDEEKISTMVNKIQELKNINVSTILLEKELDELIFDIHEINSNDREAIGYIEIK